MLESIRTITVEATTNRMRDMGISIKADTVRRGIQQGVFPFGICIECAKQPRFIVYEKKFEQWAAELEDKESPPSTQHLAGRKGEVVRENLKSARRAAGLTQQAMADRLGLTLNHYQKIEYGILGGSFAVWDALEDLLGVHQRILRASSNNRPGKEENQ